MTANVVIVGGGQAAVSAALRLRSSGFEGRIKILSEEPGLPYQRPPLSKKYLKGEMDLDRLHLRPAALYDELGIALYRNTQVLFVDRVKKRVVTASNSQLPYDRLILATGATPRRLPEAVGGRLANVHTFRSLSDADRLAGVLHPGQRLLVLGGGYIGLEMAAVARQLGLEVTLVEMQKRILNRVAAPETANWFRDLHRRQGVDLREGVGLQRLVAGADRAEQAVLSDGSTIDVDLVVAGIGVSANDQLARSAGLFVENGIITDAECRTSDRAIYAVGDCAVFPFRGEATRLESVQNACDQGEYVADHITGRAPPAYLPQPWFWSDQYDVSLKIAGLNRGFDRVVTREGSKPGGLSVWYYRRDALIAVDAMNDTKAYMTGKRWLADGQTPTPDRIGDAGNGLNEIPMIRHIASEAAAI